MKPFRERNPVIIGALGIVVLVAGLLAALRADRLPLIGGGDTYYAAFAEAGGLATGDEIRVAGVRIGKVTDVELVDDYVRVEMRVEDPDVELGDETTASIRVRTLLGAMYVALVPAGSSDLDEGGTIPIERTSSPFDVVQAFSGLAETTERIDTDQLATALDVLAETTRFAPEDFQQALTGVSRLSSNIAARDAQLNTLLTNLSKVSRVLGDRSDDIIGLMEDGDTLFRALVSRREAIHDLLVSTTQLSQQLTGLVRDTREDLKPALDNLAGVVKLLEDNQSNLDNTLRLMAPFYRVFTNTLGTGPWFDTIIQNIPPVPSVGG